MRVGERVNVPTTWLRLLEIAELVEQRCQHPERDQKGMRANSVQGLSTLLFLSNRAFRVL